MLKPVPNKLKLVTTTAMPFPGVVLDFNKFFATRAGMPALGALEHASTLLHTALKTALDVAMTNDDHRPWAVVYMLENTLALLNATVEGMQEVSQ